MRTTESIFANASFLGRVVSRNIKSVLSWWKLRYEALRFHPVSIMVPLPPLSRVEMNAKDAPLTAAARAQESCCPFLLDAAVVVIDRMTEFLRIRRGAQYLTMLDALYRVGLDCGFLVAG